MDQWDKSIHCAVVTPAQFSKGRMSVEAGRLWISRALEFEGEWL